MASAQHHGTARIGEGVRSDPARGEGDRLPSTFLAPVTFTLSAAPHWPAPATGSATPAPADTASAPDLYWQGQVDRQREPMALVDATGRIIRTTPAFVEALAQREGAGAALLLAPGPATGGAARGGLAINRAPVDETADGNAQRLRAALATDQPALDAAIARAVRAVAPVPAAVRCARRDGGAAVVVMVQPIPRVPFVPGRRAGAGAATLTLIDPLARPPAATTLWCEAFDLTPSEAAVAALLVAGHSLESAAASRGSRATTLRVHLRHLFAKTGTARQSDLVALLLRMG